MGNSKNQIIKTISYVSLIIIGLLVVIGSFLPLVGIVIKGALINILDTIKNVLVLIIVSVIAHGFISGKAKWVKVLYWVAIIVYITGIVLTWIK